MSSVVRLGLLGNLDHFCQESVNNAAFEYKSSNIDPARQYLTGNPEESDKKVSLFPEYC